MSSMKPNTTVLPAARNGSDSPLRKIEAPVALKTSDVILVTCRSSTAPVPPSNTWTVACTFASVTGARARRSRKPLSATAFA